MWIESHDREMTMAINAAVIGRAMGNDVPMPDPTDERRKFEEALRAEPERGDPIERMQREALGLPM